VITTPDVPTHDVPSEEWARDWLRALPECDDMAMDRLAVLVDMLGEENQRQNLVSAKSLDQVWLRHIVDSAQLLPHVPRETTRPWLDLGTGAGFPGLVIAALRPELEVVMVESRARRIEWLDRARIAMGLEKAQVIGQRLELVPSQPCSVISARAFAPLEKLLALSSRFSTSDTIWLLPKGQSASQELQDLRNWRHVFHVEQSLTDPQAGIIVGTLAGGKGKSR
jgi:16S rRNA (guanine527-N7)-methyltransferase